MRSQSPPLFPQLGQDLPDGFLYRPALLTEVEQLELIRTIEPLQFQPFDFHGYRAKRRVIQFGFHYDPTARETEPSDPIPAFVLPVRDKAAVLADVPPEKLVEAIITEYSAGAAIGWHRDAPQFEIVTGISLASSCRLRFKRMKGKREPMKGEKISSVILEPGSGYLLSGSARWQYQHSIPAVEELRYSITFRTLREQR
jgi:alkylated DNA repair dioxygenase AlkB